jgi:Transglycosylase SLT domain
MKRLLKLLGARFFVASLFSLSLASACTLSAELTTALEEAAVYYGLEPALLHALVYQESRYCTDALSPKGAIGLGQLMPGTAAGLGIDPNDPVQNLYGAAAYLRQQWDTFEDWQFALAAYNAGPGAVTEYQGIPPYEETQNYVLKILDYYTAIKGDSVEASQTTATLTGPVLADVSEAERDALTSGEAVAEEAVPVSALAPLEGFAPVGEVVTDEVALETPTITVSVVIPKPPLLIVDNKRPATAPIMLPNQQDAGLTLFNANDSE